jgi:hypothetical protein
MNVVNISIDENLINTAKDHSKKRMAYEYNRSGYDLNTRLSMITLGTIGQLGFKKYLNILGNIDYKFQLQAGNYDDFDFRIKEKTIEIKTSGYDNNYQYLNLLYSKDQFEVGTIKNYHYCVQIFVDGYDRVKKIIDLNKCKKLTIFGYIDFNKIQLFRNPNQKFWGDYYKVPLKSLRPIKEIIKN